jgi:porphobilinogen synthase
MVNRPRRNRKSAAIRSLVRETRLTPDRLIYPLFITADESAYNPIASLPGQAQLGEKELLKEIEESLKIGINAFVLFPAVAETLKDETASYSWAEENFYLHRIRSVKERFPEAVLMSDVAMDPYSTDGHDGLVKDGKIVNDATMPILAKMSVAQAQAGIDIIGPSDMMDGRVGEIREALDENGYTDVSIMSYTAKYASALRSFPRCIGF